jgi:integrase
MALYAGKAALLQAAERAGMAARELAVLKTALNSVKGSKRPEPEVRVVTPEERRLLLEALPLRVRLVARALYATGARVSELLAVRREQVDLDGERARVRLVRTKGDVERLVRIPAGLLSAIDAVYGAPGRVYLFESRHGQAFSRQYITRELARASKRVLGRRIGAHVLRHSRATDLYQHTRRIKAVSALLGHSGVDTTARYYVRDDFSDAELFNGEAL